MAAYEDQQEMEGLFEIHLDRTSGDENDPEEKLREELVTFRINCVDDETLTNNGGVDCVFLLDTSWSMEPSIPKLQASTLAFRDVLVGEVGEDPDTEEGKKKMEDKKESKLRKFGFDLIEFANNAVLVYSTHDRKSSIFAEKVKECIRAKGSTNLQGGLELAFERIKKDKPTVMCVLTDGMPNIGFQNAKDLYDLKQKLAGDRIVDVMAIGFGSGINSTILEAIGEFSHITENTEIPVVFGNTALRVLTAFAFQTRVEVVTPPEGTAIDISDRLIIGSEDVGTLFSGRSFSLSFMAKDLPKGSILRLHYYDVANKGFVAQDYPIPDEASRKHPMKTIVGYYEAEKNRMLRDLCNSKGREKGLAKRFLQIVETWERTAASDARKEVERACDMEIRGQMTTVERFRVVSESRQQSTGCYTTSATSGAAARTITSACDRTSSYYTDPPNRHKIDITSAPSQFDRQAASSTDPTPEPGAAERVTQKIYIGGVPPSTVQSWSSWALSWVYGGDE